MAIASHLGPWLLGTVKTTTGTTAGTVRNMGATVVTQSVPLVASAAVTLVVPAGALIINAYTYVSTAGSPTTAVNLTVGGTAIGTLSCAQGQNALTVTAANVGTMLNVGTTDATVSFTSPASIVGTLVVQYVVRNADGTVNPTSAQN